MTTGARCLRENEGFELRISLRQGLFWKSYVVVRLYEHAWGHYAFSLLKKAGGSLLFLVLMNSTCGSVWGGSTPTEVGMSLPTG